MAPKETAADKELDAFVGANVQEGRRIRVFEWHRFLLTGMMLVALGWLVIPLFDELKYHFSGQEVLDLGNAVGLSERLPAEPDRYVRLNGILGNKGATINGLRPGSLRIGPVQVRQILGASVFVEFDQEKFLSSYTRFTSVTMEGRLADFGSNSELNVARDYLTNRFGLDIPQNAKLLVLGEVPGQMWLYPFVILFCLLLGGSSVHFLIRSIRVQIREDD